MHPEPTQSLRLTIMEEVWELKEPFRITGRTYSSSQVVHVVLRDRDGREGHGESPGIYYRGETMRSLARQLEGVRTTIEAGIDRAQLLRLLPPGGARCALDCALWDLEAQQTHRSVAQTLGCNPLRPLLTTFTVGADTPQAMCKAALAYTDAKAIKIKLDGSSNDIERVRTIRDALPEVQLVVDANQGWTFEQLRQRAPAMADLGVLLIEQPLAAGADEPLEHYSAPVPLAADESFQTAADVPDVARRYQVANIKLDKTGGLTEALLATRSATEHGLRLMVGNMIATSLSMAPAFILGQSCEITDLDGPKLLGRDRSACVRYANGHIYLPAGVWGDPRMSSSTLTA